MRIAGVATWSRSSLGERFTYQLTPSSAGMYTTMACGCGAQIEYDEDNGMVSGVMETER